MTQSALQNVSAPASALPAPSYGRLFPVAALLLLIVGIGLRVYHLGDRSLWFDEALTANMSRGTLGQMLEQQRARGSAPVVHPLILYAVEKIAIGPVAVRAVSVLASILAILMMLAMVGVNLGRAASLFSAAILAVSASQIRYAQEVREYSLTVLLATVLIYCILRWEAAGDRMRHPVVLYILLFMAPLIQYGTVLLAFAVLCTMAILIAICRDTRFRMAYWMFGCGALAAGGLLSLVVTLRYQVRPGPIWYLASNYFDPHTTSLFHFLGSNLAGLFSFFIPGQVITACFGLCALIYLIHAFARRTLHPVLLLAVSSLAIAAAAGVAKIYPFGGIRQCLFLAPVLILFAGMAFANVVRRLVPAYRPAATVAVLVLIFLSGYRGLLRQWPYGEFEDTLSILRELAKSSSPADQVWVNHDAVAAIDFYTQGRDRRFIYGNFHGDAPQKYVPELLASVDAHKARVWLVFSHLEQPADRSEEQLIVNTLRGQWDVERVVAPLNTALYVARRRANLPED